MYRRDKSLRLQGSASALSNNLSVHVDMGSGGSGRPGGVLHYAVVHKFCVNLISSSLDGQNVNQRQIICKEPSATYGTAIIQARLVTLPSRVLLVLTSQTGLQMFDADSALMLYWYALGDMETSECFGRGICGLLDDAICVGTSEGKIIVFDIPSRGTNFTIAETLKGHDVAICDLQSDRDHLVSSDDSGSIVIWSTGPNQLKQMVVIPGYDYPCTSLALWNDLVVGGYGSGHIRVFNASRGHMCAEVCAHAKWINAIDIAKNAGLLLSVGEDTFVRVWQLSNSSPHIDHVHNECISNQLLQGAKFISPDGRAFGCTGYDSNEILFYMAV